MRDSPGFGVSLHPVSSGCPDDLRNPANQIILASVKVDTLTYTLTSTARVNPTADLNLMKNALSVSGNVTFTSDDSKTLTISSPMFVGYRAYQYKQLVAPPPPPPPHTGADAIGGSPSLPVLSASSFDIVPVPVQKRVK